jgi:hypothetical protein
MKNSKKLQKSQCRKDALDIFFKQIINLVVFARKDKMKWDSVTRNIL